MLLIPRSAVTAAASLVAGAALYGVAAGGVVAIDDDLRAVTPPPARFETVELRRTVGLRQTVGRAPGRAWGCPGPRRPSPSSAQGEV